MACARVLARRIEKGQQALLEHQARVRAAAAESRPAEATRGRRTGTSVLRLDRRLTEATTLLCSILQSRGGRRPAVHDDRSEGRQPKCAAWLIQSRW